MFKTTDLLSALFVLLSSALIACTGGTNAGTITPTPAYQTQAVQSGNYYVVNVSCGNSYNFTFCSDGGTAAWDTQLTVLDNTGATQLAYNDDACGLQSNVSWTAGFTGTVRILISLYNCNNAGGNFGTMAYNCTAGPPANSSFTFTAGCGGGTSTVTGDPGGVFSWNPSNPGDGAVLNTSSGAITGGVEGTTYTINYTVCGSTTTHSIVAPPADCWTLNGNAQYINVAGEQCIQLTAAVNGQLGCAWNGSQIDFAGDFSLTLDYYFGANPGGADGNTFTFQPSSSTACGNPGGQLGAGGIPNALVIEFDTYDNDFPTHLYDMLCDHIAVEIDGNLNSGAPLCGPVCAKPGGGNIDDGVTYTVDMVWNAGTQTLDIYFNGLLRLSCNNDFVTNTFGGASSVYWGVTAATGGLNNQQYFCPSTIIILPAEMGSFSNRCIGKTEVFDWTTISEDRVDYFKLEYSYDGVVFVPIAEIDAIGFSDQLIDYSTSVETNDPKQRFYRLKIVDMDGGFEYTDMIASNGCGISSAELISTISTSKEALTISTFENVSYTFVNQLGQTLLVGKTVGQNLVITTQNFAKGVYFLTVQSDSGTSEVRKVYVN
jgi:hypothetical protein